MKAKITKGNVIAAAAIVVVLVVSFVWGGGYARPGIDPDQAVSGLASPGGIASAMTGAGITTEPGISTGPGIVTGPGVTSGSAADVKTAAADELKEKVGSENYSQEKGMEIDPNTGKDKFLTDPVPEGKPVPVEPQNTAITDKKMTCTLSVRCDSILQNIEWLDPEKVELVPEDGVIFASKKVTFYEGESVFNLLQREMKQNKIHMEFVDTPMFNSAYIEGIHNLYEFDCGELSGWMFQVNDWFPNYGCSRYQLKEGDVVEWVYTCDLGRDVGGYYSIGGE